jgi:hypothetical protein
MKAGLSAVGDAGIWLWNNALQPAFKFIVKGVALVLEMWAKMLGVLGKVPGFGWAKTAADAMQTAADKANAVADGLQKIKSKEVTVTIRYQEMGRPGPYDPELDTGRVQSRSTRGGDVNVYVTGFVGDEITLTRKIRDGLRSDLVRLGLA